MKKEKRDFSEKELEGYFSRWLSVDDRSCAIVAAAFIEFPLAKAIENNLPNAKKRIEHGKELSEKLLHSYFAPLNSLSSKIDLAYALGIIDFETRKDLHNIRDIRNEFAHRLELHKFDDEDSIKDKCMNLIIGNKIANQYNFKPKTPRELFILSAARIHEELMFLAGISRRKPRTIRSYSIT